MFGAAPAIGLKRRIVPPLAMPDSGSVKLAVTAKVELGATDAGVLLADTTGGEVSTIKLVALVTV